MTTVPRIPSSASQISPNYHTDNTSTIVASTFMGHAAGSYTEYQQWEQDFYGMFTSLEGGQRLAGRLATSVGMSAFSRYAAMPLVRAGLMRLGVASPIGTLVLTAVGVSFLTTSAMTVYSMATADEQTYEQTEWGKQFLRSWVYAAPATVMGMGASQLVGSKLLPRVSSHGAKIALEILTDVVSEPLLQAPVSVAMYYPLKLIGWDKSQMTFGEKYKMEVAEGLLGWTGSRFGTTVMQRAEISYAKSQIPKLAPRLPTTAKAAAAGVIAGLSLNGDAAPVRPENAYAGALHDMAYGFENVPDDILPVMPKSATPDLRETYRADWAQGARSVVEIAVDTIGTKVKKLLEYPIEEDSAYLDWHGVDMMANSSLVPELRNPTSVEEGRAMWADNPDNAKLIEECHAYEEDQYKRMPESIREEFRTHQATVADIYTKAQENLDTALKAIAEKGGFPTTAALNTAYGNLNHAIYNNAYLKGQKVKPIHYQILALRRDFEEMPADHPHKESARQVSLRYERSYVIGTLTRRVSMMRKAEVPREQWSLLDRYADETKAVYDRIIGGEKMEAQDLARLQRARLLVFPQTIDWKHTGLSDVLPIEQAAKTAELDFDRACEKFFYGEWEQGDDGKLVLKKTGIIEDAVKFDSGDGSPGSLSREELLMKREALDAEFQNKRFKAEVQSLRDKGIALDAEDEGFVRSVADELDKAQKDYMDFWKAFNGKHDVTAREHARNDKCKQVLTLALIKQQWTLFHLFEKYKVQNADGSKAYPSCVSLSKPNAFRNMEALIKSGKVDRRGLQAFFKPLISLAPIAISELGFMKIKDRLVADLNLVDRVASDFGASTVGDKPMREIIYGLKDKEHILGANEVHDGWMDASGFKEVFLAGLDETASNYKERAMEVINELQERARHGNLLAWNHTQINEFKYQTGMGLLGIEDPILAQDGAVQAFRMMGLDLFADWGVGISREKGSGDAIEKIMLFLGSGRNLGEFPNGTRQKRGMPWTFNPYSEHHSLVFDYQILTDRLTSGMHPKIMQKLKERGVRAFDGTVAHNSSHLDGPTWVLSGGLKTALGFLSRLNTLSLQPDNMDVMIGFGPMYSQAAYWAADQVRELYPQLYRHADGQEFTTREAYTETLQYQDKIRRLGMAYTAAAMPLSQKPARTDAQVAKAAANTHLTSDQRSETTIEGQTKGLDSRLSDLSEAYSVYSVDDRLSEIEKQLGAMLTRGQQVDEIPESERRATLQPLEGVWVQRLNTALARDEAEKCLTGWATFEGKGAKEAREVMIQQVQLGAYVAQQLKARGLDASALSRDFDHVDNDNFVVGARGDIIGDAISIVQGVIQGEVPDIPLIEYMTIKPSAVAFRKGYQAAYGQGAVFLSATPVERLRLLADHIDKVPIVKAYFETVFGSENMSTALAKDKLGDAEIQHNASLVTVEKSATNMHALLKRFEDAGMRFGVTGHHFTKTEEAEIKAMLEHEGDIELKMLSQFGERAPKIHVDDRPQNCKLIADHNDVIMAVEPQVGSSLGRRSLVANTPSDISARTNDGRSGQDFLVARAIAEVLSDPQIKTKLLVLPLGDAPKKLSGLRDETVELQYSAGTLYKAMIAAHRDLKVRTDRIKETLTQRARVQRMEHRRRVDELTGYFTDRKSHFEDHTRDAVRFTVDAAMKILAGNKFEGEGGFQGLEKAVALMKDGDAKTKATEAIAVLRQKGDITIAEEVVGRPSRSGLMGLWNRVQKYGALGMKYGTRLGIDVGKTFQNVADDTLTQEFEGSAFTNKAIELLSDKSKNTVKNWVATLISKDFLRFVRAMTTHDGRRLFQLGLIMRNKTDLFGGVFKIDKLKQADAVGVATKKLVYRYFRENFYNLVDEGLVQLDDWTKYEPQIRQMAEEAASAVYEAGCAYVHAVRAKDHVGKGIKIGREMLKGDYGKALLSGAKKDMRDGIDSVVKGFKIDSTHLEGLDERGVAAVYMMEGVRHVLGKGHVVSKIFDGLESKMKTHGFSVALDSVVDMAQDVKVLADFNHHAGKIANDIIAGRERKAEEAFMKSAEHYVSTHNGDAVDGVHLMASAIWTSVSRAAAVMSPADRDRLQTAVKSLSHKVYWQAVTGPKVVDHIRTKDFAAAQKVLRGAADRMVAVAGDAAPEAASAQYRSLINYAFVHLDPSYDGEEARGLLFQTAATATNGLASMPTVENLMARIGGFLIDNGNGVSH